MHNETKIEKAIFFIRENKVVFLLIAAAFLISAIKFSILTPDSFFIIGDDPRRHLSVIKYFIENRAIVFEKNPFGEITAYTYYPPLYHVGIAAFSFWTRIEAQAMQNITPFFFMLLFFFICYKMLNLFFLEKTKAMFAALVMLFFLPIPVPNPHYFVYYVLLPAAIYFIAKSFREKKFRNYFFLFLTVLAIGLTHSQSIEFYFIATSIMLFLGIVFFRKKEEIRNIAWCWIAGALAYASAFFILSFMFPTFWEAILHYFNLTLLQRNILDSMLEIYKSIGSENPFIAIIFLLPAIVFGIIFATAGIIEKIKNSLSGIINQSGFLNAIGHFWTLKFVPPAIVFLAITYFLFWNILLTIIQFVLSLFFNPAMPYFARIVGFNRIYWTVFFAKPGFENLINPYTIGIVLLLAITTGAIIFLLKKKGFFEKTENIVFLSFLLPLYFSIICFPFITLADTVNPLILDRFYYYTYCSLAFFCAPAIVGLAKIRLENWKKALPFAAIGIVLALTATGMVLSSSFSVDPVQNQGYEWLVKNSPVKENAEGMNFDILGYYHLSGFPKQYSLGFLGQEFFKVFLQKKEQSYIPQVTFPLLGQNNPVAIPFEWKENPVGATDSKIFDNGKISFYFEGKQ